MRKSCDFNYKIKTGVGIWNKKLLLICKNSLTGKI